MLKKFALKTSKRDEMIDITAEVQGFLSKAGVETGMALVYCPHTTAGITINENADPDVKRDMLRRFDEIYPWNHTLDLHDEGNTASHLKASTVGSSQHVIIHQGSLVLGTWQGIYFCEFDGPRQRDFYSEEILDFIKEYYSFQPSLPVSREEFRLTDNLFDMLGEKKKLKKVLKLSSFTPEEEKSFNRFIDDLDHQQWSLYNISYFNIPHYEKDPFLENIVFFLPSPNGIWLVEYTDHPTAPVHIRLASLEEWNDLLAGVSTVSSYAI